MFSLIAILTPSVLGLKIIDYFKKDLNIKQIFYYYFILLLFSNVGTNIIVNLLFNINENIYNELNIDSIFFSQYTLTSVVISVLLVIIYLIIDKNLTFKLEVENVKKEKTKTKRKKKNNK